MSVDFIKEQVLKAELSANRIPGSVTLIAVSKVQPPERIEVVLKKGHLVFGENRVQEAFEKWPEWQENYKNIDLHLLGPLQTNKVKQVFKIFHCIHSLDREKLARTISEQAQMNGYCPKLFVQINTGRESQKSGILPENLENFVKLCQKSYGLEISGLMCIPPMNDNPDIHFSLLKKISEHNGLSELSMGMSADFELAIKLGATHIRVGSAIFGKRQVR